MNFGQLKMYIHGELVSSIDNQTKQIFSPLNEERIATLSWANSLDSKRALKSAEQGFHIWSKTPIKKRKEWMLKLRDKILEKEEILRKSISYEMGKPYNATAEDIESITNSLKYYSDIIEDYQKDKEIIDPDGTHSHYLVSKPIGIVVAYLAWNFPLLNAGFKLGPALASGCSIVLKPSELSPVSLYIIGEILHESWLLKKSLTDGISTNEIDGWYNLARKAGATGGKILGAGAGGFLMVYAPEQNHDSIKVSLSKLRHIPISFEPLGSQIILFE